MIRFLRIAKQVSEKSTIRCAHGAIVMDGKKVVSKGYNHNRTQFKNLESACSCHAERDAVMKLLSLKGWRKKPWCLLWG